MTPDYALLGILLGLILLTWWVSEKAAQLRDAKNERLLARKVYELDRSGRGWE